MAAVQEMLTVFDRRRCVYCLAGVDQRNSLQRAEGAFYLFPNIEELGLGTSEFASQLLEEEKVAVVPGEGFGAPGYMRLSYAVSDEVIEKGLERIARFCAKLA